MDCLKMIQPMFGLSITEYDLDAASTLAHRKDEPSARVDSHLSRP
jgi:hypothetical protein